MISEKSVSCAMTDCPPLPWHKTIFFNGNRIVFVELCSVQNSVLKIITAYGLSDIGTGGLGGQIFVAQH